SPVLSAPYLTRSSETPARTAKSTHCASQKSFPSSMFSYAHKDVLLVVWRPSGPHCKVCSNFSHAARYQATEPIAHSYGTSRCPLSLGARDSDRRRVGGGVRMIGRPLQVSACPQCYPARWSDSQPKGVRSPDCGVHAALGATGYQQGGHPQANGPRNGRKR